MISNRTENATSTQEGEQGAALEAAAKAAETMDYGASFSDEYERGHDDACRRIAAAIRALIPNKNVRLTAAERPAVSDAPVAGEAIPSGHAPYNPVTVRAETVSPAGWKKAVEDAFWQWFFDCAGNLQASAPDGNNPAGYKGPHPCDQQHFADDAVARIAAFVSKLAPPPQHTALLKVADTARDFIAEYEDCANRDEWQARIPHILDDIDTTVFLYRFAQHARHERNSHNQMES